MGGHVSEVEQKAMNRKGVTVSPEKLSLCVFRRVIGERRRFVERTRDRGENRWHLKLSANLGPANEPRRD